VGTLGRARVAGISIEKERVNEVRGSNGGAVLAMRAVLQIW